ncbi:hypothetical protein CK203_056007 [Vitis vinifera]|uniref:Uncharacterized protein n=1 Tax=Vitis vinifera TaxID=29760 RepID=A0A438GS77_VITVI|nr:hypothetical protein CK203_056007 [Vitis vinifera]
MHRMLQTQSDEFSQQTSADDRVLPSQGLININKWTGSRGQLACNAATGAASLPETLGMPVICPLISSAFGGWRKLSIAKLQLGTYSASTSTDTFTLPFALEQESLNGIIYEIQIRVPPSPLSQRVTTGMTSTATLVRHIGDLWQRKVGLPHRRNECNQTKQI